LKIGLACFAGRIVVYRGETSGGPGRTLLEHRVIEGDNPVCAPGARRVRYVSDESGCLGIQPKVGGKFHLKLNIGNRPIANKYREGKMKRTLKRELKGLEIAKREPLGRSVAAVDITRRFPVGHRLRPAGQHRIGCREGGCGEGGQALGVPLGALPLQPRVTVPAT
jgi:hypothetical protein